MAKQTVLVRTFSAELAGSTAREERPGVVIARPGLSLALVTPNPLANQRWTLRPNPPLSKG